MEDRRKKNEATHKEEVCECYIANSLKIDQVGLEV